MRLSYYSRGNCHRTEFLRDYKPRILRQRPIDFYIVDFYCPKAKLVIEIDGSYHFHPDQAAADAHRTANLEQYGLAIIRFSNKEVLQQFEEVCCRINGIILNKMNSIETEGIKIPPK
ncbi:MAG: endonuclease domain-containing protein [Bacteroidota bacterium]